MRISLKLLVISELVLLVTVLVLVVPVWNRMRQQVVNNMQNELKAIASTGALEINGDLHQNVEIQLFQKETFSLKKRSICFEANNSFFCC